MIITKGRTKRRTIDIATGREGIGKTTLCSHYPGVLFVPVENGCGDLDAPKTPIPTTWEELREILRFVSSSKEAEPYETVAIDGLDAIEQRLIWPKVCAVAKVDTIEEVGKGYGKGFRAALDYWRMFQLDVEQIHEKTGKGVVMCAHAQLKTRRDPRADFDVFSLRIQDGKEVTAAGLLTGWAENVWFVNWEEYLNSDTNKMISTGRRIIHTVEDGPWKAKTRINNLPSQISYELKTGTFFERCNKLLKEVPEDVRTRAAEAIAKSENHPVILLSIEQKLLLAKGKK